MFDSHLHLGDISRIDHLLDYFRESSLEGGALLSLPLPGGKTFNREVAEAKRRAPDLIRTFGSLSRLPGSGSGEKQLAALMEEGFDGLKLWEAKPSMAAVLSIDPEDFSADLLLASALRLAEGEGVPVICHVGDPPDQVGMKPWLQGAELMCRRYPRLQITFPHLLFLAGDLERLSRFLDDNPNALLDLSPGRYFYPLLGADAGSRKRAVRFFDRFRDRILLGSDAMFFSPEDRLFPYADVQENRSRINRLLAFLAGDGPVDNPYPPSAARLPEVGGLALSQDILDAVTTHNHLRYYP